MSNEEEQVYATPESELTDENNQTQITDNLASRGIRLGSYILDSVIYVVCAALPGALIMFLTGGFDGVDPESTEFMYSLYAYMGVFFLIILGVNCYFLYKNGQTIAKRLLNIKIVRTDNSKVGFVRVFWLRTVLVSIFFQIPIIGGVIFLVDSLFIFRQDQRCVHDLLADTMVVNT